MRGLDFGEGSGGGFDCAEVAVGVQLEGFAAVGFFDSVEWVLRVLMWWGRRGYSSSVAERSMPRTS